MGPKTRNSSLILQEIESTNLPQEESHSSIAKCAGDKPSNRSSPGGGLGDEAPERNENLVLHSTKNTAQ